MVSFNRATACFIAVALLVFCVTCPSQAGDRLIVTGEAPGEIGNQLYISILIRVHEDYLWRDKLDDLPPLSTNVHFHSLAEAETATKKLLGKLKDPWTFYSDARTASIEKSKQYLASTKKHDRSDLPAVSYKMLKGNIGLIKIRTFGRDAVFGEVQSALESLQDARAYIIDLDDNPGGLTAQAFAVFALFVNEGNYAQISGREDGKKYEENLSVTSTGLVRVRNGVPRNAPRDPNLTGNKPVTLLANHKTASAAEMFINAMLFNHRAVSIGETTYGKGVGQTTHYGLPGGGSLRVTDQRVFDPAGRCIHKKGIPPSKDADGKTEQMETAIALLMKQLNAQQ